jgi:hypothetical protein
MSTLKSAATTATRAGVVLGLVAASLVGFAAVSQAAATSTQTTFTLTTPGGPDTGSTTPNVIGATTAKFFKSGSTLPLVQLQFGVTSCATAYTASSTSPNFDVSTSNVTLVSSTKLQFNTSGLTMTPAIASSATSASGVVCVYSPSSAHTLVGKAAYTIATAPAGIAISPAGGPTAGGQTVTVTGSGFAAGLTATVGGVPLTNITLIDSTAFTGVTGAHAPTSSAVSVTVTSVGGTGKASSLYTYGNSLTVSPNTAPSGTTSVVLDVLGSGFNDVTWGTTTGLTDKSDSTGAHVYLVNGTYNVTTAYDATHAKAGTVESNECISPVIVSDNELTCTLNLAKSYNAGSGGSGTTASSLAAVAMPDGGYNVTLVSDGALTTATKTVVSSSATFTVASF